jgi:hypothetical protein
MRTCAKIAAAAAPIALVAGTAIAGNPVPAAAAARGTAPDSPAAIANQGPPVPVIVFLKDQRAAGSSPGQRSPGFAAEQAPYLREIRQAGATAITSYRLVDAFAATMPQREAGVLAASPGIARVIPDSPITGPVPAIAPQPVAGTTAPRPVTGTTAPRPVTGTTAPAAPKAPAAVPGACSQRPALEPEGLALTGTDSADPAQPTARRLGYTGAGVTVAFLAGGIDTGNVNFMRDGRSVITDYEDFSGQAIGARTGGGAAFAYASAIAGQGDRDYDSRGFSALSPATACDFRIEGVAPGASLVALQVFGGDGVTSTSGYLRAIDYAVTTDHVNVIDESFGPGAFADQASADAVREFNDAAVAAGTTVVVAGGDGVPPGAPGTVVTPAGDPDVISVGATTDLRFYAQTGYAGADLFASRGWLDDNISSPGSGGYGPGGGAVDLVAPGDLSFASCTADPGMFSDCVNLRGRPSGIEAAGGTGEAAAEVAGAAALVIQAYRQAHGGASPSPAAVRQILTSTATDLGAPAAQQGSGMLNSLAAVQLASWVPGHAAAGHALRLSASRLEAAGSPGARESWRVTVTNTGSRQQAVALAGRAFGAARAVKSASITLGGAGGGRFTSWAGTMSSYATTTFTVPPGQARLNASVTWPVTAAGQGQAAGGPGLILVTPSGQLADASLPRGNAGMASAQVLHPAPGTWQAVIIGGAGAAGGPGSTVTFGASVSAYVPFGSVTPSRLTIAPGASAAFTFTTGIPDGAGESSGAVVLGTSSGVTSVPVFTRGLVPAAAGAGGTFRGELAGTGEQFAAYQFTVPRGAGGISADVTLAGYPAAPVASYLVAPDGQTLGYGSNDLTTGFTSALVPVQSPRRQLSSYAADPVAGTWTLIVGFARPVPVSEQADSFSGVIRLGAAKVARGGLPAAATAVLDRGRSYTYPVAITNTGAAPEDVFLDARLPSLAEYTLQPQDSVSDLSLPLPESASPPEWLVPAMTSAVTVTASSKAPVTFSFGPYAGPREPAPAPGAAAGAGAVTGSYPPGTLPTPVTPGLWDAIISPEPTGRHGGVPPARASMSMTAVTQAFDPAVTSPVGDFWQFAVAQTASSAAFSLFVINPGQTRVIDATIRPAAAPGTVVRGTLYVDDFEDSMSFLSGSQLAALRYEYKVG